MSLSPAVPAHAANVPASNKPAMNSRRLIRSPRRCPADHGALGIPHSGPVLMSGAKPLYSSTSYHGSRDGGSRADGTGKLGHHEFRDGLSRPAASERLATSISLAVGRRQRSAAGYETGLTGVPRP